VNGFRRDSEIHSVSSLSHASTSRHHDHNQHHGNHNNDGTFILFDESQDDETSSTLTSIVSREDSSSLDDPFSTESEPAVELPANNANAVDQTNDSAAGDNNLNVPGNAPESPQISPPHGENKNVNENSN
jgi:hypothetical protein